MEFVRALIPPYLSSRTDSRLARSSFLLRARSARKSRALAYFILMMSRWHKRAAAAAAAVTSPGCCPTCGERMRDGAVFRPQRKVNWGLGCGRGCSACHCDRRLCPAWAVCPSICFGNQQSQTRPIMDIVVDNVDSGQRVHLDDGCQAAFRARFFSIATDCYTFQTTCAEQSPSPLPRNASRHLARTVVAVFDGVA